MTHNDYTKYAKENKAETPETEAEVKPVAEPEPVVESIPAAKPIVEETSTIEPEVTESTRKLGRVYGCSRLNVRKAPKPRAEVVCELNCNTKVEIDEEQSTIDFYKIITASGVEGYCVKTYILEIPE